MKKEITKNCLSEREGPMKKKQHKLKEEGICDNKKKERKKRIRLLVALR